MRIDGALVRCWVATCALVPVALAGCRAISDAVPKIDDVKQQRLERNAEVMEQFDRQRDEAQFQAALGRWHLLDVEGCQVSLEQLLARNPNHREAVCLLAELAVYVEQPEIALERVQRLAADRPNDALVHHCLAMLLESSGQSYGALEHFERAAQLEPTNDLYVLSHESAREAVRLAAHARGGASSSVAADYSPPNDRILPAAR